MLEGITIEIHKPVNSRCTITCKNRRAIVPVEEIFSIVLNHKGLEQRRRIVEYLLEGYKITNGD
jgi:hypothetical protein